MTKTRKSRQNPINPEVKTFLEHAQELKSRFSIWLTFLILFSCIGYFLYPYILRFLVNPLDKPLYYTSPSGGFSIVVNTSILFGFISSLPILLYNLIVFIFPTSGKLSLKYIVKYIVTSILLALIGIGVCYILVLPASLHFLSQFGGNELTALISTEEYFRFVSKYLLSFALVFQMPIAMNLLDYVYRLNIRKLIINIRYVVLVAFIVSAILTPTPDLINQTIMAAPIVLLYIASIIVLSIKRLR